MVVQVSVGVKKERDILHFLQRESEPLGWDYEKRLVVEPGRVSAMTRLLEFAVCSDRSSIAPRMAL